ncbi:hypothetical protein KJ657_00645 [Patescibacteria group bacterium]|nr:hypothetical protein [Patescibacteria group bacterium]MBU1015584.1 hypothetical protein [Patescibacteria group bacterium]MBU1685532.1 hypothetical protein [Patescibacteria group bacterium]MBU1938287.1 hypothetical protein [Patescibacteria group bacterium]
MKYEEDRRERLKESVDGRIRKSEAVIEKIRARIGKEKEILTKHEIALGRKEEKGKDSGISQARVDKKHETISALESRLEETEILVQLMRDQIPRLLTFNPVQEALKNLPPRFRLARGNDWRMVNSRFKTYQDVFTPVEARIFPNTKHKLTRTKYDRVPLHACPVAPERIPDWFVEKFNLADLKGLSEFEKLELKAEITPQVCDIFMHLQPMEVYGRQTHRAMVLEGYDEAHDGKIFFFFYSGNGKKGEERKIMQVYDSVYSAHRMAIHAEKGYDREDEKLEGVKTSIGGIQGDLIGMSENDPEIDGIKKRIRDEIDVLGGVVNEFKEEAVDILTEIQDIKDSLDRHNPGTSCARMVKAAGRLKSRLNQIFGKSGFVEHDKRILGKKINEEKSVMERAQDAFSGIRRELGRDGGAKAVQRRIDSVPDLQKPTVRPFSQYGAKLRAKMCSVTAGFAAGDGGLVRDKTGNAEVICKVFQVQDERESILRDIAASPLTLTIENLLLRSQRLGQLVDPKEVSADAGIVHSEPYNKMVRKVKGLIRALRHYSGENLSESDRIAMYDRLKGYIEDINFTEVLEKL